MRDDKLLARIAANPETFEGKPVVRRLRIPVELILSLLAQGASHAEILDDYPDLVEEDILACLTYARTVIGSDSLEPSDVGGDSSNEQTGELLALRGSLSDEDAAAVRAQIGKLRSGWRTR